MLVDQSDGRLRRVDPASDWLLSQRTRNSPNSVRRWAESLSLWWRWCVDTGADPMRPSAVGFSGYVTALQSVPKGRALTSNVVALPGDRRLRGDSTVRIRVGDVKLFYRWALDQDDLIPLTNARQIIRYSSPRASQRMSAPRLDVAQVRSLQGQGLHPRDRLTVELLHGAGLRRGEALGLHVGDLCLNDEIAQVFDCRQFHRFGTHLHVVRRMNPNGAIAKSRHARVVPIPARVLIAYQDWQGWMFDHMPTAIESRFVLLSLSGPTKGKPWSLAGLRDMWERNIKTIPGLEASYPHLLRHTYASELRDAGVDMLVISELLGHRSPSSTEIYTHSQAVHLRDAVASLADWRQQSVGVQ
jgi:integrase/recombinase XerD